MALFFLNTKIIKDIDTIKTKIIKTARRIRPIRISFSPKEKGKILVKRPYVLIHKGKILLVYQSENGVDIKHANKKVVENATIPS